MKRWGLIFLFAFSSCAPRLARYYPPRQMIVKSPVANVRAEKIEHAGTYEYDALQETQLEKGEPVLVHRREGNWFFVEAPEQLEYSHNNRWEGYPGWVKASDLSKDKRLIHDLRRLPLSENQLRERILSEARHHLGNPYLWGGRSLHDPMMKEIATGVDCSGLVNWSFRRVGWFIPRDSHEQYMRARAVEPSNLKPGDLFFFAKPETPDKIFHVGFYEGKERVLEAPSSGEKVRTVGFEERIGKPRSELKNGQVVDGRIVYFGTFFIEGDQ